MSDLDKPAALFMDDPVYYKAGFLIKQGGRIKTWKKRLFILDKRNKTLKYYKKQEDCIPKGIIHIEGYDVSDADDIVKKPLAFMVSKEGFRTYYMVPDDLSSRQEWMSLLKEASKPSHKGGAIPISGDLMNTQMSFDNDSGLSDEDDDTLRRANVPPTIYQGGEDITLAFRKNENNPIDEATLWKPAQKPPQQNSFVDNNATLVSSNPKSNYSNYSNYSVDPNATLIGDMSTYDPNATLIADSFGYDPNATLIGGGTDDQATLVGGGEGHSFGLVNNSAKIRNLANQSQAIVHISLVPFNPFFPHVERDLIKTLKFGRKNDTSTEDDFIGYDSKVVSRRHSEIWAVGQDVYIRDTKSQSGTFLNAMRLSLPGEESRPFKVKNEDTIQFGVDYRNGVEENTKCVSMKIFITYPKEQQKQQQQLPQQKYIPMPTNMSDLTLVSGR